MHICALCINYENFILLGVIWVPSTITTLLLLTNMKTLYIYRETNESPKQYVSLHYNPPLPDPPCYDNIA